MNIATMTKKLFGTLRKGILKKFLRDQRGQVTIEYTLLLVVFGLPMVTTFIWLGSVLTEYYRMVTFIECLPFP